MAGACAYFTGDISKSFYYLERVDRSSLTHNDQARYLYFRSIVSDELGNEKVFWKEALFFEKEIENSVRDQSEFGEEGKSQIGLLLPLSGKYQAFGERILRAFLLGLNRMENSNWEVLIGDTALGQEDVKKQIEKWGNKVTVIVGPLLSKTASEAAVQAQKMEIPILLLSQNEEAVSVGDFVFQRGLSLRDQANGIADWAIMKGIRRFAILYPNDSYGTKLSEFFWKRVRNSEATVVAVEKYNAGQVDFSEDMQALVGIDQVEERSEELFLQERLWERLTKMSGVRQKHEIKLKAVVNFEALFIPDYPEAIGQIVPTLAYYDVKNVVLLGANGWNSSETLSRAGEVVEGATFVDGFNDQSTYPGVRQFIAAHREVFGESGELEVLDAYAYEVGEIMHYAETQSIRDRFAMKQFLTSLDSFPGATGPLRCVERRIVGPLFYLTVRGRKIAEIARDLR